MWSYVQSCPCAKEFIPLREAPSPHSPLLYRHRQTMLNKYIRETCAGATAAQRRKFLARSERANKKVAFYRDGTTTAMPHSAAGRPVKAPWSPAGEHVNVPSRGKTFSPSTPRPLHYDDTNPETGNSSMQDRFDELVRRSILKYCPQHQDELRLSELFQIIKKEKPDFSVRVDADGVPLALLVKNCCYLQSHSGFLHFIRVAAAPDDNGDSGGGDDDDDVGHRDDEDSASQLRGASKTRRRPLEDLQKFKFRDLKHRGNGTQVGPEPWKFSATMMPFASSPRRRQA